MKSRKIPEGQRKKIKYQNRKSNTPGEFRHSGSHTIYVQDKQGIKISKIDFFATTPYILEVKKLGTF